MSSKAEHERQALHNQEVTNFLQLVATNGDWAIILKFYTALQILRAYIADNGEGLAGDYGYGKIKKFILDDRNTTSNVIDVAEAFDKFLSLSKTYRYHCQWPNVPTSDKADAETWLNTIRAYTGI